MPPEGEILSPSGNPRERGEGDLFHGRYRIIETLYAGSESDVVLVEDVLHPDREFVLKRTPGRGPQTARAARLENEYRVLRGLEHPGLVRATDCGYDLKHDRTFLVTERAPGKAVSPEHAYSTETVFEMIVGVCRVLSLLHARSVLHLDIKPANLVWDEATQQITVLDLDLASYPENAAGKGTSPYASAEVMGSGPLPDGRADLFSLGVTAFELLSRKPLAGRAPMSGFSLEEYPWVPAPLANLVADLTARSPEARPPDARAVIVRLSGFGRSIPLETAQTRRAILGNPPFVARQGVVSRLLETIPVGQRRLTDKSVTVLRGPAGVGKSRILAEATTEWRAAGLRAIHVIAPPRQLGTLEPINSLISQLSMITPQASGGSGLSQARQHEDRLGRLDRLTRQLLQLTSKRRTIVCFESVDRYDQESMEFLAHLLRRLHLEIWESGGRTPLELVFAIQSSHVPHEALAQVLRGGEGAEKALVLEVAPFSVAETQEFVRGLVAPEPVPAALSPQLHSRCGGIPLYIRETIAAHPSYPDFSGTLLGALASEDLRQDAVPASLESSIETRWLRYDATDQRLVQSLSVFPNGADASVMARLHPELSEDNLQDLASRTFVEWHEGRLCFPSSMSRHVVLATLSEASLLALHDEVREALTRTNGDLGEIAWHALNGSTPVDGIGMAFAAIPELMTWRKYAEAESLLDEVTRLKDISPFAAWWAALMLADIHLEHGHLRRARRLLSEMLKGATVLDVPVYRRFANLHHRDGNPTAATSLMERLLGLTLELTEADRLELVLDLGDMLLKNGESGAVRRLLDAERDIVETILPIRALERPTTLALNEVTPPPISWPGDLVEGACRYLALRGDLARLDDDAPTALRCHLAAVKLRSGMGDQAGLAKSMHGVGTVFMNHGLSDQAERYLKRALAIREDTGDLTGHADTANNMGVLMRRLGRSTEAIDFFRDSLRIRRQIGYLAGESFSYINIANVYYARRELEAASKYYEQALQVARRLGDARSQATVLNNLGAVADSQDHFEEAIHYFEEAERLDRRTGNLSGAILRRLNLGGEMVRLGRLERADYLVRTVERYLRINVDGASDSLSQSIRMLKGKIAARMGDWDRARDLFDAAWRAASGSDQTERLSEIGIERASVALSMGEASTALSYLPVPGEQVSPEAAARIAVIRARASLAAGQKDLVAIGGEVAEGERFALKTRMTGLRFMCAATRGLLRMASDDLPRALAAFSTALESLEETLGHFSSESLAQSWLGTKEIRGFVEDVELFARNADSSNTLDLSPASAGLVGRARNALFLAGRQVGTQQTISRRNEETMRRILEISRTLRSTAPLDELLREVVDGVVEFSGAERAFLMTVDERGRIRIPVARTSHREPILDAEEQISKRIVSEVLESGRSIRLTDAGGAYASTESVVNLDLRSILCAPLLRTGRVVGMIYVDNRSRAGQFTAADQELLDIFAAQAAIALENARLVREFARNEKIRVMGNLAGGIAHDFNNLLTTISGRTQTIRSLSDDPKVLACLDIISAAASDGAEFVSRLQEFTRTRKEQEFQSVNLDSVIEDSLEFTRTSWEGDALKRGISFRVKNLATHRVNVEGSASELREIFTNLILNSLAAMPDGGGLTISCDTRGEEAFIVVEDTGQGMTEEVRESIFDPYFTTKGSQGSGLGMSIVYNIVLRHRGNIHVESAPGRGTRIAIMLPLSSRSAIDAPAEDSEPPLLVSIGRVLVVEDEPSVLDLLSDVLQGAGFTVDTAPDGEIAIDRFRKQPADVVLTDLGMVPLTGWDVAREVKAMKPDVPVILVTGWGHEIDQATASKNQIDRLLSKPFDVQMLIRAVSEAMARTRGPAAPHEQDGDMGA